MLPVPVYTEGKTPLLSIRCCISGTNAQYRSRRVNVNEQWKDQFRCSVISDMSPQLNAGEIRKIKPSFM